MTPLYTDAHNHLQDHRLASNLPELLGTIPAIVGQTVVNGTCESDWPVVAALASERPWIIPSFGLHPWHIATRSPDWKSRLLAHLDADPRAGVGEIGLDRWIKGHDLPTQLEVFRWQLQLAAERNLPATIHCIRAWGALLDTLESSPLPACGILLHAYAGPLEMMPAFVKAGAYFSFSPYFLADRKAAERETFRHIPSNRLLVETDAPDMAPPPEKNPRPLQAPDGAAINHPLNIVTAYEALAEIRGISSEALRELTGQNFTRLFARTNP